jgi:hypothetical protein
MPFGRVPIRAGNDIRVVASRHFGYVLAHKKHDFEIPH